MPEEGTKYDWFKNELVGNTANIADLYQKGNMPEQFEMGDVDEYWNDEKIRKPFVDQYGEDEGRAKFDETYKLSDERLKEYGRGRFDIAATSEKRMLPTQYGRRAAALGLTKLYNNPSIEVEDVARDLEGRDIVHGIYSKPEYSVRQGAFDNGVLVDGKLVDYDEYREDSSDPLIYAVDQEGAPKLHEGKAYLRPLIENEEKKQHEEYATKFSDYMGFNGLDTPDWYVAKALPKNASNFVADVLDSGAELIKSFDRITRDRTDDPSDTYNAMTDFQNMIGGYLHGSTSDSGRQDWTTPEALTDGILQVGFQLGGMFGVAGATSTLLNMTKLATASGAARAASMTSRMFMSTLAADGLAKQGQTANLSPKEIATIHALSLLGYYKISKLSEWVLGTNPAAQKMMMDSLLKKNLNIATKALPEGGKLTTKGVAQIAKNLVRDIDAGVRNALVNPNTMAQYVAAAGTEALEEVTESVMELGIKETYDNIYQPLFGNTQLAISAGTEKDVRFNTDWSTLGSELAQAAVLGAVGGGIARKFFKPSGADKTSYYKYLANGQFPEVKRRLQMLHQKGSLADAGVNAMGEPVKKGEDSRNDLAYKALLSDIRSSELTWNLKGLNTAYDTNEKKLGFLHSKASLKESSIGNDLSNNLNKIEELQDDIKNLSLGDNAGSEENLGLIEGKTKEIKSLNSEIDAIKDGKRVTKYLQEVLYNAVRPNTKFAEFYEMNEGAKSTNNSRKKLVESMEEAKKGATTENVEEFSALDQETGNKLIKQLNDEYAASISEEEGAVSKPPPLNEIKKIEELMEKGQNLPSPELDILSNFDANKKATFTFQESLDRENEKKETFEEEGTGIYDDVESLSEIVNNVASRIDQLFYSQQNNSEINDAHVKLDEEPDEVVFTPEVTKDIANKLLNYYKEFDGLLETARANRADFGAAINTANQASIDDHIDILNMSIDKIRELEGDVFQEVSDKVAPDLVALSNAETYADKQRLIVKAQKTIYDHFADNKQSALDLLYDQFGLSDDNVISARHAYSDTLGMSIANNQHVEPNPLRYLKDIITLDPEVFFSHYNNVVSKTPDEKAETVAYTHARHIASPAQRGAVQSLVAFITDNTTKANTNLGGETSKVYDITEGKFLTSYQGAGKTIVASLAAKIQQMIRGGKVLVAANHETNRKNMADTMKGLNVDMDESLTGSVPFDKLMSHLKSDKQGDISLIVYDEATLLRADQINELDLTLRQINAKRTDTPIKIIYVGDKTQIGATVNNLPFNIASTNILIETTNELKFSFRTGNDQINNALDHIRSIVSPKNEGVAFSSKYDMDTLSGARFEDENFNTAMTSLMKKLTSDDDYMVIADMERHGNLRAKYDIPEGRILTPEQAQGKQWDYVIVDVETTKKNKGNVDRNRKRRLLSSVGRAKKMVLARVINNQVEGVSRNMTSVKGETIFVDTKISEDQRKTAKAAELDMIAGLNLETIAENETTGSHEVVKVTPIERTTVLESITTELPTSSERTAIESILNKMKEFPKRKGTTPDKAYVMQHSFYSYADVYDADGNPQSLTDHSEILRLKKQLIFPTEGNDLDATFSLMIHGEELPSRIKTHANPSKSVKYAKDETKEEFNEANKRAVIYATIYEAGKPTHKISMGALNDLSDFGLNQSDLFNIEIPFTADQSRQYQQSFANSVEGKELSEQEKADNIFVAPPTYKSRNFDMKGSEMGVEEFKKLNGKFWNFSSDLIYTTGKNLEKQTWLVYSPTIDTDTLDKIIRLDQARIDEEGNDILKIAVDGGRVMSLEDGFDAITTYYDADFKLRPQMRNTLPDIRKSRINGENGIYSLISDELSLTPYNPKTNTDFTIYNRLLKSSKKATKSTSSKMLTDAMLHGFFDNQAWKKHAKNQKDKYKYTRTKKGGIKRIVDKQKSETIAEDSLSYSPNRTLNFLIRKSRSSKSGVAKDASTLLNKISKNVFPNGFYYPVKAVEDETSSRQDPYAVADANSENYQVKNIVHPPMPVHKIKFDFFKDVLSGEDVFKTKIETRTLFQTTEDAETEHIEASPVTEGPVTTSSLVIPKKLDGDESTGDFMKFSADATNMQSKASMFEIFNLYFNKKPYNHKFDKFVEYYNRKIYNSIFRLTGNNPEIVVDKIDSTLKDLRKASRTNGTIIDQSINEIIESGGSLNHKTLLTNDGNAQLYYDYIIGKEFDSLLALKFPSIGQDANGTYKFSSKNFKENQLVENKEKVSHLERGNDMVKMHLFNMPIYDRKLVKGTEVLVFNRYADKRAIAKITRAVRDVDVTDIDKARAFFSERVADPIMYSFYKRFLSPESTEVKNETALETMHSISSLNLDISEDTVTGILSFIASGNETEYAKFDFEKDDLLVRFTDIDVNHFRNDLQLAIQATDFSATKRIDNDNVDIRFGKNKQNTWRINRSGTIEYIRGNRNQIGQVLQAFGIASVNPQQYEDIWNISTQDGNPLTGQILYEIASYVSKPTGKRGPFMKGGNLIEWRRWTDQYQDLKQVDAAFSYNNISGDKVNLLSLSYPLTRTNQKLAGLRANPQTLQNNAFVKEDLSIDAYLLKEGYKGKFASRPNRKMTEREQMDFDFKFLYLRSLLKAKSGDPQSVVFNPMTFADKGSDAAIRTTGQFLPINEDGTLNIKSLRNRTVSSISQYNTDLGISTVNAYIKAFDDLEIKHPIVPPSSGEVAPSTVVSKLRQINTFVNGLSKAQKNRLPSTGLVNQLMYGTDGKGNVTSGIRTEFIGSIRPDDVAKQLNVAKGKFDRQAKLNNTNVNKAEVKMFQNRGYLVTQDSLLDSYFYNHNYVAHNFSTMHVGSVWQYKGVKAFQDQIKRNSQITTNRQKFVLRTQGFDPTVDSIKHGRKLGKFSKTAIVTDISELVNSINYQKGDVKGGQMQQIFDGAAFHNLYAQIQMKESYGNELGFNVSSTIKPIASYMNETTGHSRFDKYASFLVTPEMLSEKGDPFIKKINDLMLRSVEFDVEEVLDLEGEPIAAGATITTITDGDTQVDSVEAVPPKNLYELQETVRARMSARMDETPTEQQVVAETLDIMVNNNLQDSYLQEVIFDSSVKTGISDLNRLESLEATQKVAKLKYTERSNEERGLVLDASHDPDTYDGAFPTQIISAILQGNFSKEESVNILSAINKLGEMKRDEIAVDPQRRFRNSLRERINTRGDVGLIHRIVNEPVFSFNNKTVQNQIFSAIASDISDETVRIRIKGGQQVVAPSYGVFNNPATGQPLKGFDAFNADGKSIKQSTEWLRLVELVDNNEDVALIKEARAAVHDITRSEYTNVQQPEVIVAPTMFSDFGIPRNTELADITPEKFEDGTFKGSYDDFVKTLDMVVLRIPATNKQSFMSTKVVGFAHDAENTFYTNLDLLYLQGADQDIDKGNILTYEMEDGEIVIPESVQAASSEIQIKNFIVSQMQEASRKSDTLMESSMPTSTSTLKQLSEQYIAEEDANVDYMNPFSQSTMFVRGQAGKTNIGIHANGLKTYSSAFYSYRKRGNDLSNYTAQSQELGKRTQRIEGLDEENSLGYFESMSFYSELINAAVDNAKDPILGALGINDTTGNIVNALAFLGYSPKEVVDFLHNPDVVEVVRAHQKYGEFSEGKIFKTFEDFAGEALRKNRKSAALQDLMHFTRLSEDYALLGATLGINREIPNSPYEYHRYTARLNRHLDGITTIQEFIGQNEAGREGLIERVNNELIADGRAELNILQVLNDNENILSYLRSAIVVEKTMNDESVMYRTTSAVAEGASKIVGRPVNDRLYKDINNFVYGMAVDEYLSQGGGRQLVLSMDGDTKMYNLGLVKAKGGELGRIEFMQDFPTYFKELSPNRKDTLQNHMMVEILGREGEEVKILKLESDFLSQTPERKVSLMSMMDMLEKGDDNNNVPDLGIPTDSSVKEMLFYYSLIKDKGGNSPTSYTALFDPDDFKSFDNFLDNWESAYDINRDMPDLIREIAINSNNATRALKGGKLPNNPKYRFAVPYKNDKTENDELDLSGTVIAPDEKKVSTNQQLKKAIDDQVGTIFTSVAASKPGAKYKIDEELAKAGYVLNEDLSEEGKYVWNKVVPKRTGIVNPFSDFTTTQDVDIIDGNPHNPDVDDDADQPSTHNDPDTTVPFSRADFENEQRRKHYAMHTNNKVLNSIVGTMNANMGTAAMTMSEAQIRRTYGSKFARLRGFVMDGTPIINLDRASLDTPMHEMGHLWVSALKYANADLYRSIVEQTSEHEMMERVAEQYPELEGEALAEEVFSTLFGLSQQDRALSSYNTSFLGRMRDTMIDFINWLNELLGDLFGTRVSMDDTMLDIMNKVGDRMLSSSMFNFTSADIQTLGTMGVQATPLSTELRALQDSLVRKGLMETVC